MNHNDAIGRAKDESFDNLCDGCCYTPALLGFRETECVNVLHPNDKPWPRRSEPDAQHRESRGEQRWRHGNHYRVCAEATEKRSQTETKLREKPA
jgi:hypothetical protein